MVNTTTRPGDPYTCRGDVAVVRVASYLSHVDFLLSVTLGYMGGPLAV